jgi:hypothetical protein
MRRFLVSALFTGALALMGTGCESSDDATGSLEEQALKIDLPDGGSCLCKKGKNKRDGGDEQPGKSGEDHGKPDGGKPDSDEQADGGKGRGKSDESPGKSDEDHGKPDGGKADDLDDAADEDTAVDEDLDLEARKFQPDAGSKGKRSKLPDCSC